MCSCKRLKSAWSLVSKFSPIGSLILQILQAIGLMIFSKELRNMPLDLELQISGSSIFHSLTTEGKFFFFDEITSVREQVKCI